MSLRDSMVGALIATVFSAGCGASDPLGDFTDAEQARVDSFCGRCWMSGGWASEAACRGNTGAGTQAFYGDLSEDELACMRERYEPTTTLDDALACVARATNQFVSCISRCTNDPADEVASTCFEEYEPRQAACLADPAARSAVQSIRDCASP